ncbi:MAG: cobalamin biosynthesis protein CobD [Thermodesulfatator sp.]|nr:MAG: cobalamin biosynthesis protein CobD [Thermodesulfatator sp.]
MGEWLLQHVFFLTGSGSAILAVAVFLDLLLGDKQNLPHPVRFMGALITGCEKIARASDLSERASGCIMAVGLSTATFSVVFFIVALLADLHFLIFFIFSTLAVYFSISLKCLADEALKVQDALDNGNIELARRRIAMLVSRDTQDMTEEDISKAAVETVAENLVDGVISPFFYAALGGPALCLCFKMISTLDSMVGYRNKAYKDLGMCSARLDDAANYIPARLSVPIIAACSFLSGSSPMKVFSCVSSFGRLHKSPNSGLPEAAFAAALDVRLGGRVSYHGRPMEYPWINKEGKNACRAHIKKAVLLLYSSALLFFAIFLIPGIIAAASCL